MFNFTPKIVLIGSNNRTVSFTYGATASSPSFSHDYRYCCKVSWNGNKLSWYASDATAQTEAYFDNTQLNTSGTTYYWTAVG